MKNSRMSLAALALVMGGLGQLPTQTVEAKTANVKTIQLQDKSDKPTQNVRQEKEIKLDGTGGIEHYSFDSGMPPKLYGQWLQQTGRQKWTKSKTRK